MNVKLGRKIKWLAPYLEVSSSKVINFNKLTEIKTKEPSLNRDVTSHAIVSKDLETGLCSIIMRLTYISKTKIKERKFYTKIDMLVFLAHELAHLDFWDHSPGHKKLESELTIIFMDILIKQGYISDEDEFGPHQIS